MSALKQLCWPRQDRSRQQVQETHFPIQQNLWQAPQRSPVLLPGRWLIPSAPSGQQQEEWACVCQTLQSLLSPGVSSEGPESSHTMSLCSACTSPTSHQLLLNCQGQILAKSHSSADAWVSLVSGGGVLGGLSTAVNPCFPPSTLFCPPTWRTALARDVAQLMPTLRSVHFISVPGFLTSLRFCQENGPSVAQKGQQGAAWDLQQGRLWWEKVALPA
ncbi:PREDICTED: uncharacterized protein LOC108541282 [Rhinopithecus bieti]|uniref:uncharacterized protein LOC108541282 n=1 Tax=Rhinopithecus bieti TaxID=61621 RepID=UPI00083BCE2B|nr:PREDICTED: uncharacterized protein LOC108541282 [Rhinopithecus bieti]